MSGEPSYGGVPDLGALTDNERAWIEFLRLLSRGTDPVPTLRAVQALRAALESHHAHGLSRPA